MSNSDRNGWIAAAIMAGVMIGACGDEATSPTPDIATVPTSTTDTTSSASETETGAGGEQQTTTGEMGGDGVGGAGGDDGNVLPGVSEDGTRLRHPTYLGDDGVVQIAPVNWLWDSQLEIRCQWDIDHASGDHYCAPIRDLNFAREVFDDPACTTGLRLARVNSKGNACFPPGAPPKYTKDSRTQDSCNRGLLQVRAVDPTPTTGLYERSGPDCVPISTSLDYHLIGALVPLSTFVRGTFVDEPQ